MGLALSRYIFILDFSLFFFMLSHKGVEFDENCTTWPVKERLAKMRKLEWIFLTSPNKPFSMKHQISTGTKNTDTIWI